MMKPWFVFLIAIIAVAAGWLLRSISFNQSSITEVAHRQFDQHMRKIIATAESMPANSYGFAPGDSDRYFLEVAEQVGFDADNRCSQLANLNVPDFSAALKALPRPEGRPSSDAFPEKFKNRAVNSLKQTTDLCDKSLRLLSDSQLNQLVLVRGEQKVTKAEVLMDLLAEVAKAENEMDMYLKLTGSASAHP